MANFLLMNRVLVVKPSANVDALYGPYLSLESACSAIPVSRRALGLTVGIETENGIEEYWWKSGTESDDLVEKSEKYELVINSIRHTSNTTTNEITFYINVSGRGFGVLTNIYLGSNKITSVSTLLNQELVITIKAPENPGNYNYTISTVDTILGNGVLLDYEITWKEVDVKISPSSSIFTYKVKSLQNVSKSSFSFLIYKIDSLQIDSVSIVYGNNEFILFLLGNGEYLLTYTVNISNLSGLQSGDLILIKIEGENLSLTFVKDVVQLTAPGVFAQCVGTIPLIAYNKLSFSATFSFEAENEGNYQVVIKDGNTIVYNSSLLSYTTNTLTIKLEDDTLSSDNLSSAHTLLVFIDNLNVPSYTYNTLTLMYVAQEEQLDDLDSNTIFNDSFDFNLQDLQTLTLNSYILDLVCYIPYTEDSSVLFNFANITINKDIIQFRNIIYPTPIQLDISLGFVCNIKSSYKNLDYYYDALFINGVLCAKYPYLNSSDAGIGITNETEIIDLISNKIRLYYNTNINIELSPEDFVIERNYKARNPELADSSDLPIFRITPLANILSKANLTTEQLELIVDNKITIEGVTYDIIDTTSYKVGNFGNLGENKYNIDNIISDFCSAYDVSSSQQEGETHDEKNERILSSLKKKVKKNPENIPNNYLTLTRQIVQSKALLQKYVAVPCLWEYRGNQGYLLAFTQGTSTLEYALPNFTFKFYTNSTFLTTQNVQIIPKIERTLLNILTYSNEIDNNTEYYEEKELVAKADYMESSHLNNTPTAMFYNAITTQQTGYQALDENGEPVKDKDDNNVRILQNPVVDKLNAIEGIPIILTINEINYGSFMLNIGKSGKSIGFGSNGISLEGTSNDDNSGMSSRFGFSVKDGVAKQFIDSIESDEDIDQMSTPNEDFTKFLAEGLEYRYSGKDLSDFGEEESDENNPYSEYFRILKMWHWVYTHDSYTKVLFEEMFNFDFAALYYIQMMIFGQTDNLGKNCMFDQFEENGLWYVRPYDMDSLAGLNNNGVDNLTPVIEISKLFVLADEESDDLIFYLNLYTPRFPYSSKTSNLWIRFYRNLKPEIEAFYGYLRRLGYSAESVITLCQKELIDKLKITQYNIDFLNKYLTNLISNLQFAYGNRWVKFKDWIQKRFDFCDTYFAYNKYQADTTGTGITYNVKYSLPQYTIYKYNNMGGEETISHWGRNCELTFNSVTKLTMYFSPKYIVDDDKIFLTGFSSLRPKVKLNNLVSYSGTWYNLCNVVDLSENTYLLNMTIDSIGTTGDGVIPNSILTLSITNSSQIPLLVDFSNLKSITFSNCEGNIYLENCPNLLTININSCKQINLTLINCGNENSYLNLNISSTTFNQVILNGSYINYLNLAGLKLNLSFTGSESHIKVVNLHSATLLNGELDITNLETDVLLLNSLSRTKIIVSGNKQKSYNYLGLENASIIQWGNTLNTFDGSCFNNISNVAMVSIDKDYITNSTITTLRNNTYSKAIRFRLLNCKEIKYVTNLLLDLTTNLTNNDTRRGLFQNCEALISITNSSIKAGGNSMFYKCYNLATLPSTLGRSTITILGDDGTNMFRECHKLSYTDIEKVLSNNLTTKYWNENTKTYLDEEIIGVSETEACKITNYSGFLTYKTYTSDTTIDLSYYSFATNMSSCFCVHAYSAEPTVYANTTNPVTITFIGKLSKVVETASMEFSSNDIHKYVVDDNIILDCFKLVNLNYCFAYNSYSNDDYYFKLPILPNNENLLLNRLCMGSRVDLTNLKENGLVYLPSNTKSCYTMFYRAAISEETEISQIFSKCTNLVNATNCFRNCTNFTCTDLVDFESNLANVNICGIFAENSSNTVVFGFSGNWFSEMYSTTQDDQHLESIYVIGTYGTGTNMPNNIKLGPYYSTRVRINSSAINIVNTKPMQGILHGAKLYALDELLIVLDINCNDCRTICKNLTLATDSLNIILNIGLLKNIKYADEAFNGASILSDSETDSIQIPNTLVNGLLMFANTNILKLPIGLELCSQLNDISRMFLNCHRLGSNGSKLPTDRFFLPISVKNINYLFDGCYKLSGGIPSNFIETREVIIEESSDDSSDESEEIRIEKTLIKELIQTFSQTAILQEGKDLDELNISEMFPQVTNVTGLFYNCGSGDYSLANSDKLTFNSLCFSKCVTCDDLFNSSSVYLKNNCDFTSAKSMRFMFASSIHNTNNSLNYRGITNITIGNNVDISGMFAKYRDDLQIPEVLDNMSELLLLKNQTRNSIYGMLYGHGNDTTKEEYKYLAHPSVRPVVRSRSW